MRPRLALRSDWWEGTYRLGDAEAPVAPRPSLMATAKQHPWMFVGIALLFLGAPVLFGKFLSAGATRSNPRGRRSRRRRPVRVNAEDASRVARAKDFREDFHWGIRAKGLKKTNVSRVPRALVKLGKLEAVTYSTNKKGDGFSHYEHDFGPTKKPTLAMDIDNKRLHIVGGGYTVTDRGIER